MPKWPLENVESFHRPYSKMFQNMWFCSKSSLRKFRLNIFPSSYWSTLKMKKKKRKMVSPIWLLDDRCVFCSVSTPFIDLDCHKLLICHCLDHRTSESSKIRAKYPERIPVIVQKAPKSQIPDIDKRKFLVPADITVAQFMWIIRKRIQLPAEKAIFLFVGKVLPQSRYHLQLCPRCVKVVFVHKSE